MNKKLLLSASIVALVAFLLSSCTSEYHPQFAGRYHPKIQNTQQTAQNNKPAQIKNNETASLTTLPAPEPAFASTELQPQIITEQSSPVTYTSRYTSASKASSENKIEKPATTNSAVASTTKTETTSAATTSKKVHHSWLRSFLHGSGVDRTACAIIAIFIPPLGVYLYENKITTHFWISLVLTLVLFWIVGIIYSEIVILGN